MEQKTLVAIVLSAAILFGYDAIFVAPKRAQMAKESKISQNKELTASSEKIQTVPAGSSIKTTNIDFKEKKYDFESTNIRAAVSNVGASLHNVGYGKDLAFPLEHLVSFKGFEDVEFKITEMNSEWKILTYENSEWKLTKSIKIEDENIIKIRMEIVSKKILSILNNPQFLLFTINDLNLDPKNHQVDSLQEYSFLSNKKVIRKGNATKFSAKENKTQSGNIEWAGFRTHFSALLVKPEFESKAIEINTVTDKTLNFYITPDKISNAYEFTCYVGPQDTALMKKYGKNFEKVVAFSNYWILEVFAKAIYYTIPFIHSIFRSWGLSIILISLLIYGITYPLTIKSMMSMRKMQQVQPKIKALQDRFKSEPQKLNAEIMEIYRREKINPLGGCLPFLLQMPIFVALYQVLWRSYYFQGKSFLWIKDLAKPDQLITFSFSLPFIGNEFNILPILMGAVMFLQQKVSSKNMIVTDEQQAMQQKMMRYFFPVFIGFIFYHFASGLSLYFTVFYSLSTLTQWKMSKLK